MVLRSLLANGRNPWLRAYDDPFIAMQRALDRSFGEMFTPSTTLAEAAPLSVRLDVKEDEKAFHITADLPGMGENEIDVTFDDGVLTIRGERKIARDEDKGTWHITERSHGNFVRQLSLPAGIDVDKIEAKFNKGVLNLELPKLPPEEPSAKKIQIKAAN